MLAPIIQPIRAFKDNYIWVIQHSREKSCWVVDPGDAEPVLEFLQKTHLSLVGILLTHHHADHSGGIAKLHTLFPETNIIASERSPVQHITHLVKENDEIICGQLTLRVLDIPGHTLDHIAFYNDNILFCGDTLFSAGCGKVFEGTLPQMYATLQKIANLPDTTKIYCGHEYTLQNLLFAKTVEPHNSAIQNKIKSAQLAEKNNQPTLPSTLADEKTFNPFLRCEETNVIHAVNIYAQQTLRNPLDIFAQLREWKNRF